MYKAILILHIVAGMLALLSGLLAIVAAKGRKVHNQSGRVYYLSMYAVGFSAIVMSLLKFNSFLLAIGIFALYLTYNGTRSLFYFRLRQPYQIGLANKLPGWAGFVTALFMIGFPGWQMYSSGKLFVPVLAVFGIILLVNSLADIIRFRKLQVLEPGQKSWLLRHIGMMGGAYISTFTAFAVTNIHISQQWLIWTLPTLIGSILIGRAIGHWKIKLKLTPESAVNTPKAAKGATAFSAVIFFLFLTLPPTVKAQSAWLTGHVTDGQQKGLAYVNIGIPGTSTGTVTETNGAFNLLLPAAYNPSDSIRISHLGYETQFLPLKAISGNTGSIQIKLKAQPVQISPVEIKPGKTRLKTYGSQLERSVISTNFSIGNQPLQNLGAAIGKGFNLRGSSHFLKQLNVFFDYNTFDTVVFRVQVYRLRNNKPGESLLRENIYWTLVKHRKGWANLNLEPYGLVLNEKVLVSLEWVGHSRKGKYIGLPLVMPLPGAMHYYKFGSQNNWKIYPTMSTSINLVTETGP